MVGSVLEFAAYGLCIKIAVALLGTPDEGKNSLIRAMFVALLLTLVSHAARESHLPMVRVLAPFGLLAVIHYVYDVGWIRSLLILLAMVGVGIVFWLLAAAGVVAAIAAIFHGVF